MLSWLSSPLQGPARSSRRPAQTSLSTSPSLAPHDDAAGRAGAAAPPRSTRAGLQALDRRRSTRFAAAWRRRALARARWTQADFPARREYPVRVLCSSTASASTTARVHHNGELPIPVSDRSHRGRTARARRPTAPTISAAINIVTRRRSRGSRSAGQYLFGFPEAAKPRSLAPTVSAGISGATASCSIANSASAAA